MFLTSYADRRTPDHGFETVLSVENYLNVQCSPLAPCPALVPGHTLLQDLVKQVDGAVCRVI